MAPQAKEFDSTVTPSDEAALQGNEEYREFIDKLTDSNVDKYVDLPMIAVMGDTSSGKSSLLSMLSAIELPSSDELTTRCPIMLKMARSETKLARVEVIWKDKPSGKSDEDIHFPIENIDASSWENLTEAIARAQQHIVKASGKEVARDVVSVKLESPSCENLTLIDLPGIVRATGKGESESLAKDIQSLIEDYLQNPRCVILAVHPCNVDFHNSQIMAEARKVDPETRRTIPVLTKPDLIDEGAELAVRDLLLGLKTDAFERGFHMVKGRGQASLNNNDSIISGLQAEEAFFNSTPPWRDIEDKNLLGTKNLRIKLSAILMGLIRQAFPSIIKEMKAQKRSASEAFAVLGEVPNTLFEKRIYYNQAKDNFVKSLQPVLSGIRVGSLDVGDGQNCSARFHIICKDYRDKLFKSKFSRIADIFVGSEVSAIDIDGRETKGTVAFIHANYVYLDNVFDEEDEDVDENSSHTEIGLAYLKGTTVYQVDEAFQSKCLKGFEKPLVQRNSDSILAMIEKHRTRALPVFINSQIFDKIVSESIESQWKDHSLLVLEEVSDSIAKSMEALVHQDLLLERFPKLRAFIARKCLDVVELATSETTKKVEHFIVSEKTPYSQDHYLFENITKNRTKLLRDRLKSAFRGMGTVRSDAIIRMIDAAFDANEKKSVDQHMAEEMLHILDGYGKVAVKRFSDTVPMLCANGLIDGLDDKVNHVLSMASDKDIEKLLTVPNDEHIKRNNLKRKIETLEDGIQVFDELF